jgi:hypothetical protein
MKACVCKLKEELLCNGLRSGSSLSSAPSIHIPGAYLICNEATDGRYQKCNCNTLIKTNLFTRQNLFHRSNQQRFSIKGV